MVLKSIAELMKKPTPLPHLFSLLVWTREKSSGVNSFRNEGVFRALIWVSVISSFNFFTENWAFIPNGPAVSKSKLQWPRIESDIARQQNQSELPEGRFFTKCNSMCPDINEQN